MKQNSTLPVTVLMPVYNGESYLNQTVPSILKQTFKKFEFIIVNDGSTDRTADILKKYAKQDRRIKLLHYPSNKGYIPAMNLGLRAAAGLFVARIDCGDISHPQRLELQYQFFKDNPGCVLLGTQINRINMEGEIVGSPNLPEDDLAIRKSIFDGFSVIAHPTAMYRRIKGLYYRENAYPSEDYDLWSRILKYGTARILHRRLVDLVNDPASVSHKNMVKQVMIVRRLRNLLVERIKYGEERSVLPDYRRTNHWWWQWATEVYRFKIKNNYYRFHPMNFLLNAAITLLCPATLVPKTPLKNLFKWIHQKEFKRFCAPERETLKA